MSNYLADIPPEVFCIVWQNTKIVDYDRIQNLLKQIPSLIYNLKRCVFEVDIKNKKGEEIMVAYNQTRLRFPNIKTIDVYNADFNNYEDFETIFYSELVSNLTGDIRNVTMNVEELRNLNAYSDGVDVNFYDIDNNFIINITDEQVFDDENELYYQNKN